MVLLNVFPYNEKWGIKSWMVNIIALLIEFSLLLALRALRISTALLACRWFVICVRG